MKTAFQTYIEEMTHAWPDSDADIVARKASFIEEAIPPDSTDPHLVSALKSAKLARKFGLTVKGERCLGKAYDAADAYVQERRDSLLLPHARRGEKTLNAAKKGHEEIHGTPQEKEARREKYKAEWNRLREKNPLLSDHAIDGKVAKKFEVSSKTIQRARNNPA